MDEMNTKGTLEEVAAAVGLDPSEGIPVSAVTVVSYLDENGTECWALGTWGEVPTSRHVGLLQMAAFTVMLENEVGQ